MFDWILANYFRNYQILSETAADVRREQWKFLAAQSQLGFFMWNSMLGDTGPEASSSGPPSGVAEPRKESPPASLETVAAERMKEGFAPPREIYDVQNRGRIDWSSAPDWAKPIDPEVFEGSSHEG